MAHSLLIVVSVCSVTGILWIWLSKYIFEHMSSGMQGLYHVLPNENIDSTPKVTGKTRHYCILLYQITNLIFDRIKILRRTKLNGTMLHWDIIISTDETSLVVRFRLPIGPTPRSAAPTSKPSTDNTTIALSLFQYVALCSKYQPNWWLD